MKIKNTLLGIIVCLFAVGCNGLAEFIESLRLVIVNDTPTVVHRGERFTIDVSLFRRLKPWRPLRPYWDPNWVEEFEDKHVDCPVHVKVIAGTDCNSSTIVATLAACEVQLDEVNQMGHAIFDNARLVHGKPGAYLLKPFLLNSETGAEEPIKGICKPIQLVNGNN